MLKTQSLLYQSYHFFNPTPTTASIFVIITLYLQLPTDECLLFLDIILDVSTRVPDYLDIIIPYLVSTILPDWNIF